MKLFVIFQGENTRINIVWGCLCHLNLPKPSTSFIPSFICWPLVSVFHTWGICSLRSICHPFKRRRCLDPQESFLHRVPGHFVSLVSRLSWDLPLWLATRSAFRSFTSLSADVPWTRYQLFNMLMEWYYWFTFLRVAILENFAKKTVPQAVLCHLQYVWRLVNKSRWKITALPTALYADF